MTFDWLHTCYMQAMKHDKDSVSPRTRNLSSSRQTAKPSTYCSDKPTSHRLSRYVLTRRILRLIHCLLPVVETRTRCFFNDNTADVL